MIREKAIERPANETPREELLMQDVAIQFKELRKLRAENADLKDELQEVKSQLANFKKQQEDEEKQEYAFYIRSQRESLGISRGEMARRLNMLDQTLANYEKGKGGLANMEKTAEAIRKLRRGINAE